MLLFFINLLISLLINALYLQPNKYKQETSKCLSFGSCAVRHHVPLEFYSSLSVLVDSIGDWRHAKKTSGSD